MLTDNLLGLECRVLHSFHRYLQLLFKIVPFSTQELM